MALPGVSRKKPQGRLEVNPWGFGDGDTKDLRPTESQNHRMFGVGRDLCGSSSPTPLQRKGFWQHMKAFELLQKWLALHSTAASSTTIASPGLDVQIEGPLHTSYH